MPRINVVTGAASGIGLATKQLLESRGEVVIGVDLHDAEVQVDLTSPADRKRMIEEVRARAGGSIDSIIAVAGLAAPIPATASVNYFGMVSTLEGLRPLLAGSASPRAVGVASFASITPGDEALIDSFIAGDETAALERAAELATDPMATGMLIYPSSKAAFARWIRRSSITADWAGAGIPLNAIAPGVVSTPMMSEALSSEHGRDMVARAVPMPLNGFADALVPARLLVWLASEENSHLCGQVVFIDGGSDAAIRGDRVW
ncbi:SDR family oxidoreductase [Rathayibacter sp. YIM 133350]|uniref:SDR family oxidoreductase n=1 Tax=Rathayibacter sp. YIM 133350 TaxID=3131992 RepID=UPI00307EEB77